MNLLTGDVVWVEFGPAQGKEQEGRRPAVVVSSNAYLAIANTLAIVVPVTSRDRGWPNHVPLGGTITLGPSFAMVEQVRTIARERVHGIAGSVDAQCLRRIQFVLRAFLGL